MAAPVKFTKLQINGGESERGTRRRC